MDHRPGTIVSLGLVLVVAAGLGLAGCGTDDRTAGRSYGAAGRPAASAEPTPGNPSETPTVTNPAGVQCLDVPPPVLARLLAGARDGVRLVAAQAFAQESDSRAGLYFVSVQVDVSGPAAPAADDSRRRLGVWVVDATTWGGGRGTVLSADADAQRLTGFDAARTSSLQIAPDDPDVGGAEACQLV